MKIAVGVTAIGEAEQLDERAEGEHGFLRVSGRVCCLLGAICSVGDAKFRTDPSIRRCRPRFRHRAAPTQSLPRDHKRRQEARDGDHAPHHR